MNFVQLHIHSYYSLLDGIPSPEEYVKEAKKTGMKALALTDHGSMSGILRFSNSCRKEGIKGIIGCEFYINDNRDNEKGKEKGSNKHVVLLVKNKTGYKNLLKINYDSFKNGFYYKGRTTTDFIFKHSKGLICFTACMSGIIAKPLIDGNMVKAEKIFLRWKKVFKDDFYGELHFNELEDQIIVTDNIYYLCRKHKVKYVATGDCHYIKENDAELQDYLLMINQRKKISDDNIFRFDVRNLFFHMPEYYYKANKKYNYRLAKYVITNAIQTTKDIADKCNFSLSEEENKFPAFIDQDGYEVNSNVMLKTECVKGLKRIFNGLKIPEDYIERTKKELRVIVDKSYSDYFLIVQDIINFCNKKDIAVGPGRGSAAGSLISYLLGITKVDPLRFNLLFERFLNKDRNDAPDIDLDFESNRKSEIEEYLKQKYGEDRVAHIITFSTFKTKGALWDMARVKEKDKDIEFKSIIKRIDNDNDGAIYYVKDQIKDKDWTNKEKTFFKKNKEMFLMADRIVGRIRQFGRHAGGTVITPSAIYNYIPVSRIKGEVVTAFKEGKDFRELTQLGVLKIDILGLETVSILKNAVHMVEDDLGVKIDLNDVSAYINDKHLYEILCKEDCIGIFQFESQGINSFMKEVQPENFEDVAVINALYRPAIVKSNEHMKYVHRRRKLKNANKKFSEYYKAPIFGKIIDSTYGTIAYQEQFIEILHKLGGFTLEEADKARKIFKDLYLKNTSTENKILDKRLVATMTKLRKGARENAQMRDNEINKLIDKLAYFAEYSFNRSHSVSYAIIAMQTLYMREYFTKYYFTALLNTVENKDSVQDFKKRNELEMYINFIKKKISDNVFSKIDITKSTDKFYMEGEKIRVPLSIVHGVGSALPNEISKARPFISFSDFCMKELKMKSNKTAILNLIDIGAFDNLNGNRKALHDFWVSWSAVKTKYKKKDEEDVKKVLWKYWNKYKNRGDYTMEEKRKLEKEVCKFNIFCGESIEIVKKLSHVIKNNKIIPLNQKLDSTQHYCFKIVSKSIIVDKNNNEMMFLIGKDWENNQVKIVVFHNIYKVCSKILKEANDDEYYVAQGKLINGSIIIEELNKPFRKLRNLLNNINL